MNELIRGDNSAVLMQAADQQARMKAAMLDKASQLKNNAAIDDAAKDFEAVFLTEIMKPMFESVHEPDPLFGGGQGEKIFNGFMVQEYGKLMAERGGIGIAEKVKAELMRIQEVQNQRQQHNTVKEAN